MTTEVAKTEHSAIEKIRQTLSEIELDVTTNFTLADAIRLGAGSTPAAVGRFGENGDACALSAAFLAAKATGWA
jgi:hypothetical protein